MDRAAFRDNLHRLTAAQGLDFEGLALGLRLKGADKKWLRRLWNDGLETINQKREQHLEQLAAFLELDGVSKLWETDTGKKKEIAEIVGKAWDVFRLLEKLYANFPLETTQIVKPFLTEKSFVISWVANDYGYSNAEIKEAREKIRILLDEADNDSAIEDVIEELQLHPEWSRFVKRNGGEVKAQQIVKEQWRESLSRAEKMGVPLTPDAFASLFRQRFFSE